ncbi:MAG: MATE family efflux transporter [Parachlamydiaceae bacterium]|nr:MATE family efflux transporter [Parachlamydiaceae bacterium]
MSTQQNDFKLTCHPRGSLRELWSISFPLMLSLMSSSLMFFWDRLLLINYSVETHNAATSAGAIVSFLQFAFICTTCIAEVFVGRNFGAGKLKQLGVPVWQMIWLSFFSVFIFIPLGLFAGNYIFAESRYGLLETEYFSMMMYFGPIFCLASALSAFYIGRGRLKFITILVVAANVLNTGLAYVLIFGIKSYIQPMGITGAALATGVAQFFQASVLFIDFLRAKNREKYGTGQYKFVWSEFYECMRLGFPSSIAHTIEILAWAVFFRMLMSMGEEQLTIVSVAQSILFLFTFLTEGISKGATAIAANMIGAQQWSGLRKLLFSGVKFYLFLFVIFGIFLALDPTPFIRVFLGNESAVSNEVLALIVSSCVWVWIFFLFDGIHWLVVGLLTSAGDTKFILKVGGGSIWLFALLPTYILLVVQGHKADMAWAITAFYGIMTCCIYLFRFFSMRWKSNLLELESISV